MKYCINFDGLILNENQRATGKGDTEVQRLVLRLSTVTYNYYAEVLVYFEEIFEEYKCLRCPNNLYLRIFIN